MNNLILIKKNYITYLLFDWPDRFFRLVRHFVAVIFKSVSNPFPSKGVGEWFFDFVFYLGDALLLPEFYRLLSGAFYCNLRSMTDRELFLARTIFGDTIDYKRVRINSKARLISAKYAEAYVTFNTIHYHNKIRDAVFIHEMTHIWQYQRFGSIYISKALQAQKSTEGYDFGGVEGLYNALTTGKKLTEFNFEQQAEIIEAFFSSFEQWDNLSLMHKSTLDYYYQQLYS